jgi:hypothetical protein
VGLRTCASGDRWGRLHDLACKTIRATLLKHSSWWDGPPHCVHSAELPLECLRAPPPSCHRQLKTGDPALLTGIGSSRPGKPSLSLRQVARAHIPPASKDHHGLSPSRFMSDLARQLSVPRSMPPSGEHSPGPPQHPQRGRVAAALGGEVTAEAKLPHPPLFGTVLVGAIAATARFPILPPHPVLVTAGL